MLDNKDKILYIGHTENIRSRMTNHFRHSQGTDGIIPDECRKRVKRVLYTQTATLSNALILEAYLIAKEKPPYNSEFNEDDKLTYTLRTGRLEWEEYKYFKGANPEHNILIWKEDVLLYEIPMIAEVYTPLQDDLRLNIDLGELRCGVSYYDRGYKIMRFTSHRHISTGKEKKHSRYIYMGYGGV